MLIKGVPVAQACGGREIASFRNKNYAETCLDSEKEGLLALLSKGGIDTSKFKTILDYPNKPMEKSKQG